jgi:hypothetical protein
MRTPYRVTLLVGMLAMAGLTFAQPTVAPPTPTDLQANLELKGMYSLVELKWTEPIGGLFFRVYRAVDDTTMFSPLAVANERGFNDYLVSPGHSYYYYVTSLAVSNGATLESSPSETVNVDFGPGTPHPHGLVEGTVTDSVSGKPLPLVRMVFYRYYPLSMRPMMPILPVPVTAWTDSNGHYQAVLDSGLYYIHAVPWLSSANTMQYSPEWYKDARTVDKATPVDVAESTSVTADMDLEQIPPVQTVQLSGTVRDTAGNPLDHALVVVLRSIQDFRADVAMNSLRPEDVAGIDIDDCGYMRGVVWAGLTDTLGQYSAKVLTGRPYVVAAIKKFYLPQFYNGKSTPQDADVLVLSGDTTGIDFNLNLIPVINNSVAGMVEDSAGTGVQSRVMLFPLRPHPAALAVRFTNTDSTGAYLFSHVPGGKYLAFAIPYDNYAPAFYKAGAFGIIHWKDADTVQVAGTVTGINIGVVPVASNGVFAVHGRVLTDGMMPVEGANVYLLDAQGAVAGYGITNASGSYAVSMLASGSYTLVVDKDGYDASTSSVPVSGNAFDQSVSDVSLSPNVTTGVDAGTTTPTAFRLDQNYPNPFNPTTVIGYALPSTATVTLKVFNVLGQEVATLVNGVEAAGTHRAVLDGKGLASGVYIYRLQAGTFSATKSMVLLK